jgi:hypothetical protein
MWYIGSPHQTPLPGFLVIREKKHKKPLGLHNECFQSGASKVFHEVSHDKTRISVSVALLNHLIQVLSALRFLFVVYGFELLVMVLLVSLVLAFVVACFSGCVPPPILSVPPSISSCIYQLYISCILGVGPLNSYEHQ